MLNQTKRHQVSPYYCQNVKITTKKGLVKLMYIFIAILRFEHWPQSLKIAQIIIIIHKPGKIPMDVPSYRTISLLPTISKLVQKLILKKKSIKT